MTSTEAARPRDCDPDPVVVALGLDKTLGFFPVMRLAWMAWLQSCGVNVARATDADAARAKALCGEHRRLIATWASDGLRRWCFMPDVDKLMQGLSDLKTRRRVTHVVLFVATSHLYGWLEIVKTVLDGFAPGVIDRVVAREDVCGWWKLQVTRGAGSGAAPAMARPTAAIMWRLGLPATTNVYVLDSKPDTVMCCTKFVKVINLRLSLGPRCGTEVEDLQEAVNALRRATGGKPCHGHELDAMKEHAKADMDDEVVRCVSPPLDFMERPASVDALVKLLGDML
jgi:hypothetical protein